MKVPKNRKVYKIDIRAIITLKGKERIILFEETEIRDFLMTRHATRLLTWIQANTLSQTTLSF